jgi:2-polyprenyl-3-methyl-5-hydroxy-6-metoxy-1,4-benzoquinol methylase
MPRMNFGYLRRGVAKVDLLGRFFGEPNLLKRLQASSIFDALSISTGDRALDFGCGSGYLTVELARSGANATGIDVNPFVTTISIPEDLKGRLSYIQVSGESLPLPDGHFDVILASEVLPMLPDPAPFVREMRRVIKPGGRLVVPNCIGVLPIERAFKSNDPRLDVLRRKYKERFPRSYEEYVSAFQLAAGTLRSGFLTVDGIVSLLESHTFRVDRIVNTPSRRAGEWFAWAQFERYLKTGSIVMNVPFLPTYALLKLLSISDTGGYDSTPVIVAYAD